MHSALVSCHLSTVQSWDQITAASLLEIRMTSLHEGFSTLKLLSLDPHLREK